MILSALICVPLQNLEDIRICFRFPGTCQEQVSIFDPRICQILQIKNTAYAAPKAIITVINIFFNPSFEGALKMVLGRRISVTIFKNRGGSMNKKALLIILLFFVAGC